MKENSIFQKEKHVNIVKRKGYKTVVVPIHRSLMRNSSFCNAKTI